MPFSIDDIHVCCLGWLLRVRQREDGPTDMVPYCLAEELPNLSAKQVGCLTGTLKEV